MLFPSGYQPAIPEPVVVLTKVARSASVAQVSRRRFVWWQLPDQTACTTYPLTVDEIHARIINPNRAATGCFHCDGTHEIADF